MCSSTLSLTSTLDRDWLSTPRPDYFIPGESLRYRLNIWVPKVVCTMLPIFHCKSGEGNLSSQSLETRPQKHADIARQDKEYTCTCNVAVMHDSVTVVAVEKQYLLRL
jgi:hypothetical protein